MCALVELKNKMRSTIYNVNRLYWPVYLFVDVVISKMNETQY